MRLSELDDAFVQRLENWGLYHAPEYTPGTSPTYEVCRRMAVENGKTITDGYRETNARPKIDAADAKTIEWCWAMSGYSVSPQHRALIKAHWVSRADPRMVCRLLKLRYLSWEPELCRAVLSFQRAVALLEGTGVATGRKTRDNAPHTTCQPSSDV